MVWGHFAPSIEPGKAIFPIHFTPFNFSVNVCTLWNLYKNVEKTVVSTYQAFNFFLSFYKSQQNFSIVTHKHTELLQIVVSNKLDST